MLAVPRLREPVFSSQIPQISLETPQLPQRVFIRNAGLGQGRSNAWRNSIKDPELIGLACIQSAVEGVIADEDGGVRFLIVNLTKTLPQNLRPSEKENLWFDSTPTLEYTLRNPKLDVYQD